MSLDMFNCEEKDSFIEIKSKSEFERDGFILIDASSFPPLEKRKPSKIYVHGNLDLIKLFFRYINEYELLTHLVIETPALPYDIITFIKKNRLISLTIVCDDKGFEIKNFFFYSSLEELKIVNRGTFESLSDQCQEIVRLNKITSNLLLKEFPEIEKRLKKLKICKPNFKCVNDEQIKFALEMVKFYQELFQFDEFYNDFKKNLTFTIIEKIQSEWDITYVVRYDEIRKFEKITLLTSDFDFNQKPFTFQKAISQRLIDIAANNRATEITKKLFESNADLTCAFEDKDIFKNNSLQNFYSGRNLDNFPLKLIMNHNDQELHTLFLSNEKVLYDGLAWFIYENSYEFKDIVSKRVVDFNKVIPAGSFSGFTLAQLIIFYQRNDLFSEYVKPLFPEAPIILANSYYPENKNFIYSSWSVLAVIIYRGQFEELLKLCGDNIKEIKLKSNGDNNSIQLLLYGACKFNNEVLFNINNYKNCLYFLMKNFHNEIDLEKVTLISDENEALPLFHFVIFNRLFSLIENRLDLFVNSLSKKAYMRSLGKEVNPLELAAIMNNDKEATQALFKLYLKNALFDILTSRLSSLGEVNLFQYSILSRNYSLFKSFIEWQECPVNHEFPENHPDYPSWLPIHAIILQSSVFEKKLMPLEKAIFLNRILKRKDLKIDVRFIESGKPHYLTKFYPSSAIFFSGNPIKDDVGDLRNLSEYLIKFLPLIEKLSNENKREILTQALYYALIYHDKKINRNYSELIKILVQHGAYPYQTYGDEGKLIIDLAEEKGVLNLFDKHVKELRESLSQQIVLKSRNERESELQCFSNAYLKVDEEHYSVVSLVRNKKCAPQHVFIIIEQIVKGRSVMHFIDFVQDLQKDGKGKIRHKIYKGKITDSLLYSCNEKMMKINDVSDLICLPPWQITNQAASNLLRSVENDQNKEIDYVLTGSRSVANSLSSKEGHNCYTWAREKILTTKARNVEAALKPTFEEWIATVPSFKDKPWYKNQCLLFSTAALAIGVGSFFLGRVSSDNNDFLFNPDF